MKKKNSKRSFRKQLTLATSVFLILPLVAFLILFQGIRDIIVARYSESVKQSVEATAETIEYNLRDTENLSSSILTNHELMNSLKNERADEFLETLNSYFISSFHIEGIYTVTSKGYHYVGADIKEGIKSFPREEIGNTMGEIIWVPASETKIKILSGTVSKNYFFMGRKIIDVNSLEELGYMSIAIDESVVQEAYSKLKEEGSEVFIFDSRGNVISTTQAEEKELSEIEGSYSDIIQENVENGYTEFERNGTEYVAIYAGLNKGSWKIVKTIPKAVLYKEVNSIQLYTLIGAGAFMAVMLLAAGFYSKRITRPITKMMDQMKQVEAGNMDVTVRMNVNNELDDLSESFNHMVRRVKALMEEVLAAERNKNELELEVLHAQINPHFLYNTLNTIRWMAKIKNENSISDAIVALVKLLRVSISLGKNMITLKEEMEYIENYLLIQKLRFNRDFEIDYSVDAEYSAILIPKLILQPIVENALIYGMFETDESESEELKIWIYTRENGEDVDIVVEDNGPGIEENVLKNLFKDEKDINKFSKVGLNNVNQRLKLYFGDKYGLEVQTEIGIGTKIVIKVPNRQTYEVM